MRENHAPPELRIQLLGGFHVALGDQRIPADAWRLSKARSLLKLLALAPTHRLHREQVFDLLWPRHGNEAALNNLHSAIYAIRRALSAADPHTPPVAYLHIEQSHLVLCAEAPLWTDVHTFEAAAARAHGQTDTVAHEGALALYTGDLLPDDRNEEWAISRRETLRTSHDALLLALVRLYEAQQEYPKAVGILEQIVAHDPAHEQARRHLMHLYVRLDQRHLALRHYQSLKDALRQELDVEPARATRRLYEEILSERFPPALSPDLRSSRPHVGLGATSEAGTGAPDVARCPPPSRRAVLGEAANRTRLIGREPELAALRALLGENRMLTLIGAGGCGKSRLARRLAADLRDTFPDGVHVVDLAPCSDPLLAPQAVARAVGMHDCDGLLLAGRLVAYLSTRELLLVLDHCDGLLTTGRQLVAALLAGCPGIQIVATSREAIGLLLETAWWVPPLSLPSAQVPWLAALRHSDAVRLFLTRGHVYQPALILTVENAAAIARICAHLDGNPLAIEEAAAQLATIPLDALVRAIVATPVTKSCEGASPQASNELLHAMQEHVLIGRLPAFDGRGRHAATGVVCADHQLATGTVRLPPGRQVERVPAVGEGPVHPRLLVPIQGYGADPIVDAGAPAVLPHRHAEHYLAVAEEAMQALAGPLPEGAPARLELEHHNLRAALEYAIETGNVELALRLAAALWPFWSAHSCLSDGRGWLLKVLSLTREPLEALLALRAQPLKGAGVLAVLEGDANAPARLQEAPAQHRHQGHRRGLASALTSIAGIARNQGDEQRRASLYHEAPPLLDALGARASLAPAEASVFPGEQAAVEMGDAEARATNGRRPLSTREREIAHLVAQSQTNRQIAAALGIAERTVDTHVVHIFKKLHITARSQMEAARGVETESAQHAIRPGRWEAGRCLGGTEGAGLRVPATRARYGGSGLAGR